MKFYITQAFPQWKFFSFPQRVHILVYLLAVADDGGRVGVWPEQICNRTGLLLSTVHKCLSLFLQEGIIDAVSGTAQLTPPSGIELPQPSTPNTQHSTPNTQKLPLRGVGGSSNTRKQCFQKPTLSEVADYVREKGYHFDPETFWNFYESKGWMVGKNKMKSWHAACVTFEKRTSNPQPSTPNTQHLTPNLQSQYERNRNQARIDYLTAEGQGTLQTTADLLSLIPE